MTLFRSDAAKFYPYVSTDAEKEARFVQFNQNQNDKHANACKKVRSKTLLEIEDISMRAEKFIQDSITEEQRACTQLRERNKSLGTYGLQRKPLLTKKAEIARNAYKLFNDKVNHHSQVLRPRRVDSFSACCV